MERVEDAMRDQIRHDLDSTESALRLMDMRKELAALVIGGLLAAASTCPPSRKRCPPLCPTQILMLGPSPE
jgi:hypothetical protein